MGSSGGPCTPLSLKFMLRRRRSSRFFESTGITLYEMLGRSGSALIMWAGLWGKRISWMPARNHTESLERRLSELMWARGAPLSVLYVVPIRTGGICRFLRLNFSILPCSSLRLQITFPTINSVTRTSSGSDIKED